MLQELTCEQVVALVSACVWRERGEQRPRVREDMQGPYRSLLEAARRIGKVGAALHARAARMVVKQNIKSTTAGGQWQTLLSLRPQHSFRSRGLQARRFAGHGLSAAHRTSKLGDETISAWGMHPEQSGEPDPRSVAAR